MISGGHTLIPLSSVLSATPLILELRNSGGRERERIFWRRNDTGRGSPCEEKWWRHQLLPRTLHALLFLFLPLHLQVGIYELAKHVPILQTLTGRGGAGERGRTSAGAGTPPWRPYVTRWPSPPSIYASRCAPLSPAARPPPSLPLAARGIIFCGPPPPSRSPPPSFLAMPPSYVFSGGGRAP